MPRFLIEVSEDAFDRLSELAHRERRPLKDQAAWLLEQHVLANSLREQPARCMPSNERGPRAVGTVR